MGILFFLALLVPGEPRAAVVLPVANMYSAATENSDVVSQAIYGTNVGLLEEKDGWSRIRTPDDYTGWVPAASVQRTERSYAANGRVAEVQSLAAHLYREPDVTKHQPMLTVPFESHLEVVAEPDTQERRWLQVRLVDDRAAWVQRGDIAFDAAKLSIDATIALAKRFLGAPYTWGGTSSYGYDCSGYMQMLCRRRGYNLPRDAKPQAEWSGMMPVERPDLQPGDLLYFGSSPKKITHTGMYVGGGDFIHATTHDRPVVQISRLDEPHWTKLLVACRRIK